MLKSVNEPFSREKMALILNSQTETVIRFLTDKRSKKVMLKDLKQEFPKIKEMDRFIDDLVVNGLLNRDRGSYTFNGTTITTEIQEEIIAATVTYLDLNADKIYSIIKEIFGNISKKQQLLTIVYSLFGSLNHTQNVIYPDSQLSKDWLNIPSRVTRFNGKKNTFLSMANWYPLYSNNLADFFNFLTLNRDDLPKEFLADREIIGDVNQTYFITYCEKKLRRMKKGKEISIAKSDIFMEMLLKMKYVSIKGEFYTSELDYLAITDLTKIDDCLQGLKFQTSEILLDEDEKLFMIRLVTYKWLVSNKMIDTTQTLHGML